MKLTCLVDNAVQFGSGCWGEHGLSYLIEANGQRILFDTGQSGTVLLHNLKTLGIEPATIDALAISHAHRDHMGGLPDLLSLLRPGIPLYANSDLFRGRFVQRNGPPERVGPSLSRDELAARLTIRLSPAPQEVVPGVWTTGEITDRLDFTGGGKGLLMAEGSELVADAYRDDMALVLQSGDHLALLCGCCHAGLLNTLPHVARTFPQPVALIAGGLHLVNVTDENLQRACTRLASMPALRRLYPSHCTGAAVRMALAQALGTAVVQPEGSPAGTVIEIGPLVSAGTGKQPSEAR